jgi:CheY-like chemotaxis protein
MAAVLNKLGCVVTFCENGALAVDALKNQPFDLVLMDIHMPVMDGLTATRTIRSLGIPMANVPIIALTADVMNNAEQNAFEIGVNAFLTKPVRLTELEAQMSALLT